MEYRKEKIYKDVFLDKEESIVTKEKIEKYKQYN